MCRCIFFRKPSVLYLSEICFAILNSWGASLLVLAFMPSLSPSKHFSIDSSLSMTLNESCARGLKLFHVFDKVCVTSYC